MPSFADLTQLIWYSGPALLLVLVWQIVRSGAQREFPVFTAYIATVCAKDIVLTILYWAYHPAYRWAYWGGEIITIILSLAVLEEILRHSLRSFEPLKRLGLKVFAAAVVLAIGVAAGSSIAHAEDSSWIAESVLTLERGIRVMQVVLLLYLFLSSALLRISWLDRSFGVMLGYGAFIATELITVGLRAHLGDSDNQLYNLLKPFGFLLALGIWNFYFYRAVSVPVPASPPPNFQVEWDHALKEYLNQ